MVITNLWCVKGELAVYFVEGILSGTFVHANC